MLRWIGYLPDQIERLLRPGVGGSVSRDELLAHFRAPLQRQAKLACNCVGKMIGARHVAKRSREPDWVLAPLRNIWLPQLAVELAAAPQRHAKQLAFAR